ncbi:hypothetical protein MBLNU230_g8549t1 [Neophaeotheca triangularis]
MALLVSLLTSITIGTAQINHNASPLPIDFDVESPMGPDGPWWTIEQATNWPPQRVAMYPSLTETSLVIHEDACSSQNAACPLPQPGLWSETATWRFNGGPDLESAPVQRRDASPWRGMATGEARYFFHRLMLQEDDGTEFFVDRTGMSITEDFAVAYPGGAEYTMDVGYFSLYGGEDEITWTSVNGTSLTRNLTMANTYRRGYIPSSSYGLHVGSVQHQINASLILGGYDRSRCLTEPIIAQKDSFHLLDIALNVSSGGSAYPGLVHGFADSLLLQNGSSPDSLAVFPAPESPYIYLPKDTCDAIAEHLPVTYNEDFNLYFWNTNTEAYEAIIRSPHYLSFTFSSGNGDTNATIKIPFALLNLTLDSPLVSTPTFYFPCSPWGDDSNGFDEERYGARHALGRAFLQAAFLATNWHAETHFLAQAPGPDLQSETIFAIERDLEQLAPAPTPRSWEYSWASTLQPLDRDIVSEQGPDRNEDSGSDSDEDTNEGGSGLSTGAIAGVAVGVVVGVLAVASLVLFSYIRRRRSRRRVGGTYPAGSQHRSHAPLPQTDPNAPCYGQMAGGQPVVEKAPDNVYYEAEAHNTPLEIGNGERGEVSELPANASERK